MESIEQHDVVHSSLAGTSVIPVPRTHCGHAEEVADPRHETGGVAAQDVQEVGSWKRTTRVSKTSRESCRRADASRRIRILPAAAMCRLGSSVATESGRSARPRRIVDPDPRRRTAFDFRWVRDALETSAERSGCRRRHWQPRRSRISVHHRSLIVRAQESHAAGYAVNRDTWTAQVLKCIFPWWRSSVAQSGCGAKAKPVCTRA